MVRQQQVYIQFCLLTETYLVIWILSPLIFTTLSKLLLYYNCNYNLLIYLDLLTSHLRNQVDRSPQLWTHSADPDSVWTLFQMFVPNEHRETRYLDQCLQGLSRVQAATDKSNFNLKFKCLHRQQYARFITIALSSLLLLKSVRFAHSDIRWIDKGIDNCLFWESD